MARLRTVFVVAFLVNIQTILGSYEYSGNGETPAFWNNLAQEELRRAKNLKPNIAVAKNVILFLGDGMGVSTVTGARILKGQLNGNTGEETVLSFEKFPHVGLAKTYNQNAQVSDSAGTAVAFLSGIKTNEGVLGVDGRARRQDCASIQGAEVTSILDWSLTEGKSVGFVTTARVTHATPGALYANVADRNWEADSDMVGVVGNCRDIARQLIEDYPQIQVILGGGRRHFLRHNDTDPEYGDNSLHGRHDGRNLVDEWQNTQKELGSSYTYVWNSTAFRSIDPETTDNILGLFNPGHMQYVLEERDDVGGEPTLEEMTEKAIRILKRNPKGYFLLVEGGRIDHGHHDGKAVKALHEALAFDAAVQKGTSMTDQSDTLTVVTADHSHVFTIGGYPSRGKPIFGLAGDEEGLTMGDDGMPFTTLLYSNGPGYLATRTNLTGVDTADKDYKQQSAVPYYEETHGGEDVAIYATGPMGHLFHGVHEQHYIAHVMAYSACVGIYSLPSTCAQAEVTAASQTKCTNSADTLNLTGFYSLLIVAFLHRSL